MKDIKKASIVLYSLLFFLTLNSFTSGCIGRLDVAVDVGKPKPRSFPKFDDQNQKYILKGSGYGVWFGRNEFQHVYK